MQEKLAAAFPEVQETYAEASDVLGFDLWQLVQTGPDEKLAATVNTQPAMLTAGVATWRAWQSAGGPLPHRMSGHSLGEYTALVCAGVFDFNDAVGLVRRRGELMQNAVPVGEGAMAAILGLEDNAVIEICNRATSLGVAEAVNFNSPGQVVVAGEKSAIERVTLLAKEEGARRAIMLPISVPSHSSLLRSAGDELAGALNDTEINDPQIEVISAVDAAAYGGAEDVREKLARQVYSPVRWVDVVKAMTDRGSTTIVECGPGKVLAGLIKRIDKTVASACIDSPDALAKSIDGVRT